MRSRSGLRFKRDEYRIRAALELPCVQWPRFRLRLKRGYVVFIPCA
jgi:hypothetical protein